jgi:hypothetical protein
VTFQGQAALDQAGYATLPQLPASVGTPEVSFGFSDSGTLETLVTVGGSTMTFWTDEDGEIADTIENGNIPEGEDSPWSNIADYDDFEQTRTWAECVHERVESATTQIAESAVESEQARAAIIAFATGRQAEQPEETPAAASYRRATAALTAATDKGLDAPTALADLFTDMRLLADKEGIDFHEVLDRSYTYYLEEKASDSSFATAG